MSKPDPITTEVVRYALETIAEEMGTSMRRTALSVVIKDLRDYSCALFDREGGLIAAALDIPSLMASMSPALKACIAKWGVDIHDGDIFITNDPYYGGVTHLNDAVIAMPVFVGGQVIAWTAVKRSRVRNPAASACWVASWMTGPSMTGSL